jgi:hypothetical protein
MADKETAQSLLDKILKESADSKLSPMDFLGTKNATLDTALKALKSGEATISPQGAIVSKTKFNNPDRQLYQLGANKYFINDGGDFEIAPPPTPFTYLKLQAMPDGGYGLPKIKNEKDGGWFEFSLPKTINPVYKERIVPAVPAMTYIDNDGYYQTQPAQPQKVYQDLVSQELPKNWDTTASVKVIPKIPGGQDFSYQDYFQSSTGVSNDVRAIQSGDVVAEKYKQYFTDAEGNLSNDFAYRYKLVDSNGSVVALNYEITQDGVLKSPNYWNHVHAGTNNVYVAFDPKSGRVAPIENFESQVVYNLSGGKTFWSQIADTAKAAAPVFAAIFTPAIGEVIGAALMESGVLTSASAAAAGAATATEAATAASAATATATTIGTGIANATTGILQGVPVDQAIGNAAITTAVQLGTPGAVGEIKNTLSTVTSNPAITNVLVGATVAGGTALLKGKNALEAFQNGGTYALVNQIGLDIPGFDDLNATAKKVITDAVTAKVSGNNLNLTPEYMINTVITTANQNKAALDAGYDNAEQKQAAEDGGFPDAKTFKAADKAGFTNIGEYQDAKDKGYDNANDFRVAKASGYLDATEYKEGKIGGFTSADSFHEAKYLGLDNQTELNKYKDGKFTSVDAFNDAETKGYKDVESYSNAMIAGWNSKNEQDAAAKLNITSPEEYRTLLKTDAAEANAKTHDYDSAAQMRAALDGGFTDSKTFKAADALGYTNIGEYQDGTAKKFDNAEDYRAAKNAGFEDEFTWKEAKAQGFTNFTDYNDAKDIGIASLDAYKKYKTGAFTDIEEYTDAVNKGYSNKAEYDDAMAKGWENKAEQIAAGKVNITDPTEYRQVLTDAANERSAKAEGYDSAAQRQAAQDGGFPNAATFKVADKAGFTNNAEFEAAGNARFNNASDYRGALAAGIDTPEEFKQYKDSNYSDVLDYRNAAAKGFYTKAEFDDATAKGYSDKATYDKAEDLGFKNASDYSIATANNIDAKTWNENNHLAVDDGWDNYAEQLKAEKLGFDDPEIWKYASAVDLENEGQDITENYLASQMIEIGNDWYAMPDMDVIFNANTGEVQDESGNTVDAGSLKLGNQKLPLDFFKGILTNPFVNKQPPSTPPTTTPPTTTPNTDPNSQIGQVIPDFQDPSKIAKRKERGTPYSYNPEWSVLNPQAPQNPQTQPQQQTQPLAPNTSDVVQSGLFSGILSPYNPQQGGPYA